MFNSFDEDDHDEFEEFVNLELDECAHEFIIDGHCERCGNQIIERCHFAAEDITTEGMVKAKKSQISNENLLNLASELPLPRIAKQELTNAIRSNPIQAKGSEETIIKLLCLYGFKSIIVPRLIDCSPDRYFQVCGMEMISGIASFKVIKKVYDFLKSFTLSRTLRCERECYISPYIYIREFLYTIWIHKAKHSDDLNHIWFKDLDKVREMPLIPEEYTIPPGHEDIILYTNFLFESDEVEIKRNVQQLSGYEPVDWEYVLNKERIAEKARITRLERKINQNGYDSDDSSEEEYGKFFTDTPHRLAAAILASVLSFSLKQMNHVNSSRVILKRSVGTPEPRLYTLDDITNYFKLTGAVLETIIKNSSIVRTMNNQIRSSRNI